MEPIYTQMVSFKKKNKIVVCCQFKSKQNPFVTFEELSE